MAEWVDAIDMREMGFENATEELSLSDGWSAVIFDTLDGGYEYCTYYPSGELCDAMGGGSTIDGARSLAEETLERNVSDDTEW